MKGEPEPERADLVRFYVNDLGENAFHTTAMSSRAYARELPNAEDVTQVGEILRSAQDDTAFCFFQLESTSASRSGVKPARSFDCRSCGSDLNQASVSRAVSASGRKVKPLLNARPTFVRTT